MANKPVSLLKKVAAVLALLGVIIVSIVAGFWASGARPSTDESTSPVLLIAMAIVFMMLGALSYLATLQTCIFTVRYDRPVWPGFKRRLFAVSIFVPLFAMISIACVATLIVSPILMSLGIAEGMARLIPFFGVFVALQLVATWLMVWMPAVTGLIQRRLLAMGISRQEIDTGVNLGISDPTLKSSRKVGLIEDDIGMLWITPDELVYRGDDDDFRVDRDHLRAIDRVVDAGSVSAYFNNVHIVLTIVDSGGVERKVRLHTQSEWTMTGTARATDKLANQLTAWRERREAAVAQAVER